MLDNIAKIREVDITRQIAVLEKWPELVERTYLLGKKVTIASKKDISSLVITGMGGSAISGEFLVSWMEKKLKIPVIANKKYSMPCFDNSLAICISYSGNTEETISALNKALDCSPTVLISSNGAFEEISSAKDLPFIKIPAGYQPRYAFPLIFFALVGFLEGNDFIPNVEQDVKKTIDDLNEFLPNWVVDNPEEKNPAKQMARKLIDKIPLVLTSHFCLGHRIKGQINENAKMVCYHDVFPEMFHNTIVAWESERINDYQLVKVELGSDLRKLHKKLNSVLSECEYKGNTLDITFKRKNLLSELMLTVAFTDFVSTYLAILNGKDPSRVPQIEALKMKYDIEQAKELDNLMMRHL